MLKESMLQSVAAGDLFYLEGYSPTAVLFRELR